jgi:hypothetical protein
METERLRRMRRPSARCLVSALAAFWAAGCGYHMIGSRTQVTGGIRSLSIGTFDNRTREFGLERNLAFAFEREIYRRGQLRLENDPAAGEGILSGSIREFRTRPVAFDTEDEALEYEAEITVEVSLTRRDDGEVLWRASRLQAFEEYSVNRSIVVPSTARFQLETTDFRDLQNLTDIQLAESQKRLAIDRMVEAIVRDVHDRILDDF